MNCISLYLCLTFLPAAPSQDKTEKVAALLVTGENNHDWEWTHVSLRQMLERSGKFEVDVTVEPDVTFEDAEALAKYDVFVLDYNGARWGEPAEANFLEAVRNGAGVAVIHAADNAFRGWVEYEQMVCLLWRDGTGHGRFHEFEVGITDRAHPITSTLPTLLKHPDELYHRLVHMHEAPHRVLATAFSDKETGGTGDHEPMIIVSKFGEGRVFHTPLGHVWRGREETHASHRDPQFENVFLRGTEWAATGSVTDGDASPNTLTQEEEAAGWRLLFDGETTKGWRGFNRDAFPDEGWEVVSGCLRHTKGGGSIVTTGEFSEFDLSFEWKVAGGANSGVKIWIDEEKGQLGPEYQILDDALHTNGLIPKTTAGSLYDVLAPKPGKKLSLVGSFNRSRIHSRGGVLEYHLNGELVLRADMNSDEWKAARSKSKFRNSPIFGVQRTGRILLQDHGDEVWFRSIKLRPYED
jgi:type 1 glutamine amidotransferase